MKLGGYMKYMNTKGFTLSEVLVVMSILGIVAAMAIPNVSYNMQKNRNAAALSRAVQLVETGCGNIIEHYNSTMEDGTIYSGYSSIKNDAGNFINGSALISGNQGLFDVSEVDKTGYTPKVYDKSQDMSSGYAGESAELFVTSAGAWISWSAGIENDTTSSDDKIKDIIFIDVNGKNKPNSLGRDIFVFGLTDRCSMIPAGSNRMRTLGYPSATSDVCTVDSQGTGMACADLVVKDGYKINY